MKKKKWLVFYPVVKSPKNTLNNQNGALFSLLTSFFFWHEKRRCLKNITPPKFNSSPLKNDGWKTILSFWDGNFSGAMLDFQGVVKVGIFPKKGIICLKPPASY